MTTTEISIPRSMDPNIYKLAMTLMLMFERREEFKNLTDCAYDNFIDIVNNWDGDSYMDIDDYKEAALDWAFTSCGRKGYDAIKELFINQED